MPLQYHTGQLEVQDEANTRKVAANLSRWVGPVTEFATTADLILLASMSREGVLTFTTLSGAAPLVEIAGPGAVRFPLLRPSQPEAWTGGLTISLEHARRARLNGCLRSADGGAILEAQEAFTNCRKYVVPSLALAADPFVGPGCREDIDLDDPWLVATIASARTAFLASQSPEGRPDISHRGGEAGFLHLDSAERCLTWQEYVGDGMFKSAGNIRATPIATLLVIEIATGDAAELSGTARYETLRTMKQARLDALQQHRDSFPVQGAMTLEVTRVRRLRSVIQPRRLLEGAQGVTSSSPIEEQAPQ